METVQIRLVSNCIKFGTIKKGLLFSTLISATILGLYCFLLECLEPECSLEKNSSVPIISVQTTKIPLLDMQNYK